MDENTFALNFPISRPHCGIAMGNGCLGAMVWGNENLHITVNRSDFWDHRGGELISLNSSYREFADIARTRGGGQALYDAHAAYTVPTPDNVFKPQRLPVGRFEFSFHSGVFPVVAELDYETGTVTIKLSNGKDLKIFLSVSQNYIMIVDRTNIIRHVFIKPSWDFEKSREWLRKYGFSPPEIIDESDINGWIQSCPEDSSLISMCVRKKNQYVISLELTDDIGKTLEPAKQKAFCLNEHKILTENRIWWDNYWLDTPEINIPDDFFQTFFKNALYKFACATNPNGCACSLQGPWHEEYQHAQWSGDYHFNVNIQQIYTLAFAIGKYDHLMPLFNMLESESFHNCLRHNAKALFGIDDGLWFTHAVDDRGFQCGGLGPGSILDPACGAWTALLYWKYYQYTGDTGFLLKRAYPFISGIMRCFEEMLEEYNGRLSIPLAISAEYGSSNPDAGYAGRDPSNQLAAAHMLAKILTEACDVLSISLKPVWEKIKTALPHYTLIENSQNEKRIAIWENQDIDECHRHHSHLACIYPFDSLPDKLTESEREVIDNSIDHWIAKGMGGWSEWCMPWAAIIQTRMGFSEAPLITLNIWKEIFINEGYATVYLPRTRGVVAHCRHDMMKDRATSEIMQLDGTMGGADALLEMLAHQHGDTVFLFKGIPDKWREVSFDNIHLPGGFIISGKRKNGKLDYINIKSPANKKLKIKIGNEVKEYHFRKN